MLDLIKIEEGEDLYLFDTDIGKASKSSIMLSALSALSDMIFQKVVSQTYTVSYFNGATTIINGLLHGFSTSLEANSDLVLITLQISKSNQKINQKPVATSLPKITGAKPIG